jgi:hypothetical protein
VVGAGPFDLVYTPGWLSNVDALWDMPTNDRWRIFGVRNDPV